MLLRALICIIRLGSCRLLILKFRLRLRFLCRQFPHCSVVDCLRLCFSFHCRGFCLLAQLLCLFRFSLTFHLLCLLHRRFFFRFRSLYFRIQYLLLLCGSLLPRTLRRGIGLPCFGIIFLRQLYVSCRTLGSLHSRRRFSRKLSLSDCQFQFRDLRLFLLYASLQICLIILQDHVSLLYSRSDRLYRFHTQSALQCEQMFRSRLHRSVPADRNIEFSLLHPACRHRRHDHRCCRTGNCRADRHHKKKYGKCGRRCLFFTDLHFLHVLTPLTLMQESPAPDNPARRQTKIPTAP